MLIAGSDDGVYRLPDPESTDAEQVLDAGRVWRVRQFDGLDGVFAAGETGLYHSLDGREWRSLAGPAEQVYAVAANPAGDRLYAGTRPARVFVADCASGPPTDAAAWSELDGFRALREQEDWGIPRHDGMAQVRSLRTHPYDPDRIVAGVEVGGVHVSDDGGETWETRTIDGFDAPHTDDVHHVELADAETVVAATGSGLYRSTDAGRTWDRLDAGHHQRYFREAFAQDGTLYAGGATGPSTTWVDEDDHALFECRGGSRLERVESPRPGEVVIGWCDVDGDVLAATHRGTLLRRDPDGWRVAGAIPTTERTRGRYLPMTWDDR